MADILSYSLEEGRGVRQPLHASLFSTWKHIVRPLYGVVCSPPWNRIAQFWREKFRRNFERLVRPLIVNYDYDDSWVIVFARRRCSWKQGRVLRGVRGRWGGLRYVNFYRERSRSGNSHLAESQKFHNNKETFINVFIRKNYRVTSRNQKFSLANISDFYQRIFSIDGSPYFEIRFKNI